MGITARNVADSLESIAPIESGNEDDELGFVYGDPDRIIRGAACMWIADTPAIRKAVSRKLDLLIVHETLWTRTQSVPWYDCPASENIVANRNRRVILEEHNLTVYRSHSNWDALPIDGVPDQAVRALGLDGLRVHAEEKYFKVHELPESLAVSDLAKEAAEGLGFPGVRVFGDRERRVKRFAFLVGGFGGNQVNMAQLAQTMGAEAVIIGEMNEFIVIAALECRLPVVATLHSASEIPAIRRQAEMLQERHPEIPIEYIESGAMAFDAS